MQRTSTPTSHRGPVTEGENNSGCLDSPIQFQIMLVIVLLGIVPPLNIRQNEHEILEEQCVKIQDNMMMPSQIKDKQPA